MPYRLQILRIRTDIAYEQDTLQMATEWAKKTFAEQREQDTDDGYLLEEVRLVDSEGTCHGTWRP